MAKQIHNGKPVILRFYDGRVMTFPHKKAAAEYVGCMAYMLGTGRRSFPRLGFDMYDDTPENAAYAKRYRPHEVDAMIWPLWYLRKGLAPVSSYADVRLIGFIRKERKTGNDVQAR